MVLGLQLCGLHGSLLAVWEAGEQPKQLLTGWDGNGLREQQEVNSLSDGGHNAVTAAAAQMPEV